LVPPPGTSEMQIYENLSMLYDADPVTEISCFKLAQLSRNFFITSDDEIRYSFQNVVLEKTESNGHCLKQ
jgi:hypothetical protein